MRVAKSLANDDQIFLSMYPTKSWRTKLALSEVQNCNFAIFKIFTSIDV